MPERTTSRGAPDDGIPEPTLPQRMLSRDMTRVFHHHHDIDEMLETYLENDKTSKKTASRVVVEGFLQHRKWYFPGRDNNHRDAPSLEKAWTYFEHFTLARHFEGSADHRLERAEPGEQMGTTLYNPFTTPESSLNEFGIGVASYFSTLRLVAIILLIAGCISIYNIIFYASDRYSDGHPTLTALQWPMRGSAICDRTEWVVCKDCPSNFWMTGLERTRYAAIPGTTDSLVLRNTCERPEMVEGMVNLGVVGFLVVAFYLLGIYQRQKETLFDQEKQTATDYSVVVRNPPKDAYDPDQWKAFFSQFVDSDTDKQVSAVCIALNNQKLIQKLIDRRILKNKLRAQLPKGVDLEDEDLVREHVSRVLKEREQEPTGCWACICGCTLLPILQIFNLFLPPDVLVDKIFNVTDQIRELQQEKYDVTEVFVTFETENGQRTALEALSTSRLSVMMNLTDQVSPSLVFQGKVLQVEEPAEPNSIRWLEIHAGFIRRIIQQAITFVVTILLIVGAGYVVAVTRSRLGAQLSGPVTTIFNTLIPQIVKLMMLIEQHPNEGGRQQSLYLKIAIFRWVNTAILTQLITPFVVTIANSRRDVIPSINSILISELWLTPTLRLLDIMSNLRKHILGPRAKTQEAMNLSFQGTFYNLGERYTDLTKVVFVCFFYSALFPATFFYCFAILIIQYYVDKFCLMRIWAPAPFIGTQLAKFSRRYFFWAAVLACGLVSSYSWAQFPYDNICSDPNPRTGVDGDYFSVVLNDNTVKDVTVFQTETVAYCDQSWRGFGGIRFPATSGQQGALKWMTSSQARLSDIYGWSSVALVATILAGVFGGSMTLFVMSFVKGTYSPDGKNAMIDFHNVAEISAYVPQFKIGAFQYPVLACNVDNFVKTWIGWTDPTAPSYDQHNVIFDVPTEGMRQKTSRGMDLEDSPGDEVELSTHDKWPIYSIVKSWEIK